MGSRLSQHKRVAGSLRTEKRHVWLPESHRLLQRSALATPILGPLKASAYDDWINSLNPLYSPPGTRIEPDRSNWGIKV